MKVGDLVRCTWQPKVAGIDKKTQSCITMKHAIKGELGMIDKIESSMGVSNPRCSILFPQFGYSHMLCPSAFEVISV